MKYTIAAKPTWYNGILFRSKLESKWAALFDYLGWKWAYEYKRVHTWLPDFVIKAYKKPVLVEVKPIDDMCAEIHPKLVVSSAFEHHLLILSNSPKDGPNGEYRLGWCFDSQNPSWKWAVMGKFTRGWGFCAQDDCNDRISGECRDDGGQTFDRMLQIDIASAWNTIEFYGANKARRIFSQSSPAS